MSRGAFAATRTGTCPTCLHKIVPGDALRRFGGRVVHEDCAKQLASWAANVPRGADNVPAAERNAWRRRRRGGRPSRNTELRTELNDPR